MTSAGPPARGYSPSPRPSFDEPTLITRQGVTRHIWGDRESGEVMDWIYVSSERIHVLVFGLPPGGGFRHSEEFRTVFRADEVLRVLSGTMTLANPQTGEVVRVDEGGSVGFGADTWHHAFAESGRALRVLEIFASPPAAGTAGTYARQQPYLAESTYLRDSVLGALPAGGEVPGGFRLIGEPVRRREGSADVGLLASTDQLTVAALTLSPGACSDAREHGGDAVVFVTEGCLVVRAWFRGRTYVFEADPLDAVYLPEGTVREIRNVTDGDAAGLLGVAPSYLPHG